MTTHTCATHTPGTLACYNGRHACRCSQCRQAKVRYDQQVRLHPRRVDATGTRRRIQALVANGWPMAWLDSRLGYKPGMCLVTCRRQWVWPATARKVHALYDALWDSMPPQETPSERDAARKACQRARASGWPPPMALDDDRLDDPTYRPGLWSRQEAS